MEVLPSEEKTFENWMSRVDKFSGAERKFPNDAKRGSIGNRGVK